MAEKLPPIRKGALECAQDCINGNNLECHIAGRISEIQQLAGSNTAALASLVCEEYMRGRAESDAEHAVDPLTGLLTRKSFDKSLHALLSTVERGHAGGVYNLNAILAYIDLDKFKPINDRFGHERGDSVLRHVGKEVLKNTRTGDIAGRLGGDELAVAGELVVSTEDLGDAMQQFGERLLEAITHEVESGHVVSASIGVVALSEILQPVLARDGSLIDRMKAVADRRLYIAKRAGRQMVVTKG